MELDTIVKSGHQFRVVSLETLRPASPVVVPSHRAATEERLPFTVRIVRSEQELEKAVFVRHSAYDRHVPAVAALLERAEAADCEPGTVVLLAESKLDGSPLGTMRIQTNRFRPLTLQQSIELPAWLQGTSQAEATRLGVALGRVGRLVKTALFKAYWEYCLMEDIEWMTIAARSPLDRQYEALLFQDVVPGGEFIPMRHAGNIPHRVLAFNVPAAEKNWRQAGHPLCGFVFDTKHPDIDLSVREGLYEASRTHRVRAVA